TDRFLQQLQADSGIADTGIGASKKPEMGRPHQVHADLFASENTHLHQIHSRLMLAPLNERPAVIELRKWNVSLQVVLDTVAERLFGVSAASKHIAAEEGV